MQWRSPSPRCGSSPPHRANDEVATVIPLAVLAGPTGSGKTDVGIEIAARFNAEIVSADSMQVYRRLDIGTAKPTRAQRAMAVHHLIDVAEPDEPFDAARFRDLAGVAIREAASRGRRVLVVGGTGLYFRVLLYGLARLPPPDPATRASLEAEADRAGSAGLHRRLERLDPAAAERIHPQDRFRIVRALEVFAASGRPVSEIRAEHRFAAAGYRHAIVAMDVPRDELRDRVRARSRAMLAAGLLDEVRGVLDAGFQPSLRPLRAFGYREPVRCVLGERSEEGLAEAIARGTMLYARRQATWLRSERGVEWVRPDAAAVEARLRSVLPEWFAG